VGQTDGGIALGRGVTKMCCAERAKAAAIDHLFSSSTENILCSGQPINTAMQTDDCFVMCPRSPSKVKGKGSPYSITERRVPELIPVLGSQPAGDVSHKPGGRLPLLSAKPAVTLTTLKRAATIFAAW